MRTFFIIILFFLLAPLSIHSQDARSFSELDASSRADDDKVLNDNLDQSYKSLASFGSFTDKTNHLAFLETNFRHERTLFVIMALLDHNYIYNNPDYRESNQKMYENDLIVERMIKVLGKNGNPKCFPTLLNIVLHPDRHRDSTVNAAYIAMTQLKW